MVDPSSKLLELFGTLLTARSGALSPHLSALGRYLVAWHLRWGNSESGRPNQGAGARVPAQAPGGCYRRTCRGACFCRGLPVYQRRRDADVSPSSPDMAAGVGGRVGIPPIGLGIGRGISIGRRR